MSTHDFTAILDEPLPCETCRYARGATGAACKAFATYLQNEPWNHQRREPDLNIGRRLGLVSDEHLARLRGTMQGFISGR